MRPTGTEALMTRARGSFRSAANLLSDGDDEVAMSRADYDEKRKPVVGLTVLGMRAGLIESLKAR